MRIARVLGPLALILLPFGAAGSQTGIPTAIARRDSIAVTAAVESIGARLRAFVAKATADPIPEISFRNAADSVDWEHARALAERAREFRIVISLFDRKLWLMEDTLTLMTAPAAVASGMTLDYAGRSWTFRTPRGRHQVLRKSADPVWTPPEWAYAEVAAEYGLKLGRLTAGREVPLHDGSRLAVRDTLVGVILPGSREFAVLPTDEHIVFDNTLYIPPYGTANRRVAGELGRYALDLGDGYMIHGTPNPSSIGRAITHGCIRLADSDIAWLYEIVPEGTPVYIY
jgi:L,D-transpeptidase-like protein